MTENSQAPYFSIIIPAYNRSDVIGEAIQSCLSQTFTDFEIVIVDDGSKDGKRLAEVIADFADERIVLHRQKNAGASSARNTGIDIARGRFIAFLDSDDRFLPTKLERFRERIGNRSRFAGFAPAIVDRGKGRTAIKPGGMLHQGEPLEHYFFSRNQMIQTSVLVVDRQSAADARFRPDISVGEDLDFCLAIEAAGIEWERIEEPLSIWFDVPQKGRSADYRGDLEAAYKNFRTWKLLSERGRYAYEGTVGAFHTAPVDRAAAMRMLLNGLLKGDVKLAVTGRQFIRCFLPRTIYHKLVGAALEITKNVRKSRSTPTG